MAFIAGGCEGWLLRRYHKKEAANRPPPVVMIWSVLLELGSNRCRVPDAYLACFRHQEDGDYETHRRHQDRAQQRVTDAAGRAESRRRDERHQSYTPAAADVVWHRHRRATD